MGESEGVVAKFTASLDDSFGGVTGCQHKLLLPCDPRLPWRVFAEELKELAGATHVLQSETGGAEEQAYSLFQESSSVGTKTSAHLRRLTCSLCSLLTFPHS